MSIHVTVLKWLSTRVYVDTFLDKYQHPHCWSGGQQAINPKHRIRHNPVFSLSYCFINPYILLQYSPWLCSMLTFVSVSALWLPTTSWIRASWLPKILSSSHLKRSQTCARVWDLQEGLSLIQSQCQTPMVICPQEFRCSLTIQERMLEPCQRKAWSRWSTSFVIFSVSAIPVNLTMSPFVMFVVSSNWNAMKTATLNPWSLIRSPKQPQRNFARQWRTCICIS